MGSSLHPFIRDILDSASPGEGLEAARSAAAAGPEVFDDAAWLTIAAGANSAAIADPRWLALCIFAHEQRSSATVDALVKRAHLIVMCGPAVDDPFCDPQAFFDGVHRFLDGASSEQALEMFQSAMDVVFTAVQTSPEWSIARDRFLRSRRFREIGQALRAVADSGVVVPNDLIPWLEWANVREVDGRILT